MVTGFLAPISKSVRIVGCGGGISCPSENIVAARRSRTRFLRLLIFVTRFKKTPPVAFFLAHPTTPAYPPSAGLGAAGGSRVHVMAYKAEKAERVKLIRLFMV